MRFDSRYTRPALVRHADERADLAVRIKAGHRRRKDEAVYVGGWLNRAKDITVANGEEWLAWLEANVGMSRRTASWYMRRAKDGVGKISQGQQNESDKSKKAKAGKTAALTRRELRLITQALGELEKELLNDDSQAALKHLVKIMRALKVRG